MLISPLHFNQCRQNMFQGSKPFDEVFSTWMMFGGNTRDLGSFREKNRQDYRPTPNLLKIYAYSGWRRRHLSGDGVRNLAMASGRS
ncbi:hypothetical protein Tco_0207837 [Tanacetum coccineum]